MICRCRLSRSSPSLTALRGRLRLLRRVFFFIRGLCRRCGGIACSPLPDTEPPQTEQPAAVQILGVLLLQTYPDGVVAEAAVVKQLAHELPQPQIPALHGAGLAHLSGGGKDS